MRLGSKKRVGETAVDIVGGLLGWMEHIGGVETVVTEFVEDNLVCGEIGDGGVFFGYPVSREEQCTLGELAAVVAVFAVTYRADSEEDMHVWFGLQEQVRSTAEVVGALVYGQTLLGEKVGRTFLAVINNLAALAKPINAVGAEGEDGNSGEWKMGNGKWTIEVTLDGVEDAGGVVHDAVGVDDGAEHIIAESPAHVLSETRADEKHPFEGPNLPFGGRYVYDGGPGHKVKSQKSKVKSPKSRVEGYFVPPPRAM